MSSGISMGIAATLADLRFPCSGTARSLMKSSDLWIQHLSLRYGEFNSNSDGSSNGNSNSNSNGNGNSTSISNSNSNSDSTSNSNSDSSEWLVFS